MAKPSYPMKAARDPIVPKRGIRVDADASFSDASRRQAYPPSGGEAGIRLSLSPWQDQKFRVR